MQVNIHRRYLVSSREDHAYQLPGTPGNITGSKDIHEGCCRDLSASPAGQCHSRGLYQQPGGHSVGSTNRTGERTVVVGSEQRHFPESPTYPRVSNKATDAESQTLQDCADWRLCPRIF